MMKKDQRIESVWTREGTIFYVWRENKRVYKVVELYEAARNLNFYFLEFSKSFNNSRSNIFPSSVVYSWTEVPGGGVATHMY